MFKEVVSLAIILGFIINIIYVDHPDTKSYTAAFVLSLVVLSPGVAVVLYRRSLRKRRELKEMEEMRMVIVEAAGVPLMSDSDGVERTCCVVGREVRLAGQAQEEADLEKGLGGKTVKVERVEECAACD
jgi:hypothetical protein